MKKKVTPETIVKREIRNWLSLMGFFHYHNSAGMGSYPGIPDRTAIKKGVTLQIEIKSPVGVQSPGQKKFEQDLAEAGGHYVLARGYEDIEKYLKEHDLWEKLSLRSLTLF